MGSSVIGQAPSMVVPAVRKIGRKPHGAGFDDGLAQRLPRVDATCG